MSHNSGVDTAAAGCCLLSGCGLATTKSIPDEWQAASCGTDGGLAVMGVRDQATISTTAKIPRLAYCGNKEELGRIPVTVHSYQLTCYNGAEG